MTHVVIGAGEVGQAIAAVLRDRYEVVLRDIEGEPEPADVLHVCFPWSRSFDDAVRAYIEAYRPSLVIIHSTVPVGTSRQLGATHSPVTGRHPHLEASIRTFTKFFGGPDAERAAALFDWIPTVTVPDQETTEAGKLLATLQYGWLIAIQKEAYRFCREVGADPDIAYRAFNEMYNAGYAGEFVLPVLRDMPGAIGGHCVIPNAHLTPTRLAETLVSMDADW